ncbi:MAG TPA: translation factor GTPase family protein [Nocardioidaceae bacterium]|nr:translation factor GTPase family protein [Nocardioidaceae bacterium]
METLNLGIVAHVDAGKTSLTERLLYAAGVIDEFGRVDDGTTQTDTMALERARGITIKSAVASFDIGDVTVNLIDTPGHPDFIAEVERVLGVLDGAVLVVSAVEGVQPQTRVLMRTLRRLGIPTLIFVNKIDRVGARHEALLDAIADKLAVTPIAMGRPSAIGGRDSDFMAYEQSDPNFRSDLVERLTRQDDTLLAAYVDDEAAVSYGELRASLAAQTARALVHPVYFGSAVTGAGVETLTRGIAELLPTSTGAVDGPVSGTVFKIERGPAGEKIAYVRMFSGALRIRDRVRYGSDREGKVTAVSPFAARDDQALSAGEIGRLSGLGEIRIGDSIGTPRPGTGDAHFAPPTLETVVLPCQPADRGALHAALTELAEQDPLINVRHDEVRREISVSLYGEVQKEVVQATLAADYGLDVTFRETTTICIERPVGTGDAVEYMGDATNQFRATVGLRVESGPAGSGIRFRREIELGSMPYAFFRAIEDTVHETLRRGPRGWQVTDCVVALTHSDYTPPPPYGWSSVSTNGGDFRGLTPLVLMRALKQAGTRVYEPMHRFRLEIPLDTVRTVLTALPRVRAVPLTQTPDGSSYVVEGEIPAARVHELDRRLAALSHGEGVLQSEFGRWV